MRERLTLLLSLLLLPLCTTAQAPFTKYFRTDTEPSTVHPWSKLTFPDPEKDLRFVIMADLTGRLRENIFPAAIRQMNLLQPEFFMSIGDLTEGGTDPAVVDQCWDEFSGWVNQLNRPFFYLPGNHDMGTPAQRTGWTKRLGRSYYYFVYKDVLFMCLNTEDGKNTTVSSQQAAYFLDVLRRYPNVRYTFVFMHQPLWLYEDDASKQSAIAPFFRIESALQNRPYSVFAGHHHRYLKTIRYGRPYIQVATTGGASALAGKTVGEFDQLTMVSLSDREPVVTNLPLWEIMTDNIIDSSKVVSRDYLIDFAQRLTNKPVFTEANGLFSQDTTQLIIVNPADRPLRFVGTFQANKRVMLSEDVIDVQVPARTNKAIPIRLRADTPTSASAITPLVLHWRAMYATPDTIAVSGRYKIPVIEPLICPKVARPIVVDGKLSDWGNLAYALDEPKAIEYFAKSWQGKNDGSLHFDVRHDDQWVYMAFDVQDDQVRDEPGKQMDHVDLYINPMSQNPDPADKQVGKYAYAYIRVGPPAEDRASSTYGFYNVSDKFKNDFRSVYKRTAGGYAVELMFPTAFLATHQNGDWRSFRINVLLDDHDGTEVYSRGSLLLWQPRWHFGINHAGSGTFIR